MSQKKRNQKSCERREIPDIEERRGEENLHVIRGTDQSGLHFVHQLREKRIAVHLRGCNDSFLK
jgi:hypothetical protein